MKSKVLIIEDEIFVASDIERVLEDNGYAVTAIAADCAEALASAAASEIALVDMNLRDGLTGPGLAVDLATKFGLKIVYVTANPSQITPIADGAIGYVRKPFSDDAILQAVQIASGVSRWTEATGVARF